MRYRATVEATHSSTSIEGNPLNIKQVEKVLSDKEPLTRHQYAELEVKNYEKALDFIDKRKTTGNQLTADDILKIHKLVLDKLIDGSEKVGAWRKNPVYIADHNDVTLYDAASAKITPQEIDRLIEWSNVKSYEIHPVIAAAILHIQFLSIHPFADGNGRTARLLTALYLGLRNYDFRGSLVLDSYYSIDKRAYYDVLHKVQGNNYDSARIADLNPWLDYFADGFIAAANILAAEVAILSTAMKELPVSRKISRNEADVIGYIKQFGSITLSEAEGVLVGAPRRTVQRKLKKMVDAGYIRSEGVTSGVRYVIGP